MLPQKKKASWTPPSAKECWDRAVQENVDFPTLVPIRNGTSVAYACPQIRRLHRVVNTSDHGLIYFKGKKSPALAFSHLSTASRCPLAVCIFELSVSRIHLQIFKVKQSLDSQQDQTRRMG
jgi:hypothetical protein